MPDDNGCSTVCAAGSTMRTCGLDQATVPRPISTPPSLDVRGRSRRPSADDLPPSSLWDVFALPSSDTRDRVLRLVPDRVAKKPCRYAWQGGAFFFGSEL